MVTSMKRNITSKPFFSAEQIAAAITAAPDHAGTDQDNPPTQAGDWDHAVVSLSLEDLRRKRGPNKRPTKEQVAIRLSPDVLEYFRAGGSGWQTRMDEALREYVNNHKAA